MGCLNMECEELEDGSMVSHSKGRGEITSRGRARYRVRGRVWWRHSVGCWAERREASQPACSRVTCRLVVAGRSPRSLLLGQCGPSLASLITSLRGHQGCPESIRNHVFTQCSANTEIR